MVLPMAGTVFDLIKSGKYINGLPFKLKTIQQLLPVDTLNNQFKKIKHL